MSVWARPNPDVDHTKRKLPRLNPTVGLHAEIYEAAERFYFFNSIFLRVFSILVKFFYFLPKEMGSNFVAYQGYHQWLVW